MNKNIKTPVKANAESHSSTKQPPSPTQSDADPQVQAIVDAENEQGFRGVRVDPTPKENYSLQTPPDAPTPETDPETARVAREATGMGLSAIEHNAKEKGDK